MGGGLKICILVLYSDEHSFLMRRIVQSSFNVIGGIVGSFFNSRSFCFHR